MNCEQGPQVDEIQFNRVLVYIAKGKAEGANIPIGGGRHGNTGYFVEPTIFTEVKGDITIAQEEIFGPVMNILKFKSQEEAIERANNTSYGLAAGICSTNAARALSVTHQLRAGTVWINIYDQFDAAAPFGGCKQSGHGRDKGQHAALANWVETKCVMIPLDGHKV